MRRLFAWLMLGMLLLTAPLAAAQMQHVVDQTGTFTTQQKEALEQRMRSIYQTYSFDTVIVTTRDSRGQTAQMYAADFYDEFRDYDSFPNGLIFSFNFDLGEYYEATRGVGKQIFSARGEADLHRTLAPYLPGKEYYRAMNSYLDYVETSLQQYATPGEDGRMMLSTTKRTPTLSEAAVRASGYVVFMLVGGLGIGLLVALGMKSRLLIAKHEPDAGRYTRPGSLSLRESSDMFLYQTVTRTRIQENTSGKSGGRGGGFTSSGGRSYGGRGGKL